MVKNQTQSKLHSRKALWSSIIPALHSYMLTSCMGIFTFISLELTMQHKTPYDTKFWQVDEFDKMNVIHQYFTQPNARFTKVAKY